jgi:hypothetical protein
MFEKSPLTTWRRVLEKLTVIQLVKKFLTFYRHFKVQRAHYWTLCLGPPSYLCPSDFLMKILQAFFIFSMCTTSLPISSS